MNKKISKVTQKTKDFVKKHEATIIGIGGGALLVCGYVIGFKRGEKFTLDGFKNFTGVDTKSVYAFNIIHDEVKNLPLTEDSMKKLMEVYKGVNEDTRIKLAMFAQK